MLAGPGRRRMRLLAVAGALTLAHAVPAAGQACPTDPVRYYDSHFHLTNYVQRGPGARDFLRIMSTEVPRSTLFGIPLQQMWAWENSGDFAPTYYLQTDAPLYYYSLTDAWIAREYESLTPAERMRLDPMITGFNPADMYATDHIRRVLTLYPGVFSGIGEFTVHKEFVSPKVAGGPASLTNPALDSILAFAGRVGLVVLLHNDLDVPFPRPGVEPAYLKQLKALFARHPGTTIIWAHVGLGRIVRPVQSTASAQAAERSPDHVEIVAAILEDPGLRHVHFDISWDEVAKWIVSTPRGLARTADLLNRHPDRFLFGTDHVAPPDRETYQSVYTMYEPLWEALTCDASAAVRHGNYARLFDEARRKVRAWERAHVR